MYIYIYIYLCIYNYVCVYIYIYIHPLGEQSRVFSHIIVQCWLLSPCPASTHVEMNSVQFTPHKTISERFMGVCGLLWYNVAQGFEPRTCLQCALPSQWCEGGRGVVSRMAGQSANPSGMMMLLECVYMYVYIYIYIYTYP